MKKFFAMLLTLVMAMGTLMGCSNTSSSSTAASGDTSKASSGPIGIVVPSADHGWTAALSYYSEQKCKELGLSEGSGYKLLTAANVNDQANQIDQLIELKCSAIVLDPIDNNVSVAAQKIVDANIPLIVFDRKVNGDYTAYVAGDNGGMGVKAAEYLGDKLGGKGTIAVMNTPSVGSVNTDRVNGFKDTMKEKYPDITLVEVTEDGYTQQAGLKAATDMLVANKSVDAIFSTDDEPSLGILQAVKDANRTDVKYISGGGGAQAYLNKMGSESDIELFTETYSPSMIMDAIQTASDIVAGKDVDKDTTIAPTFVNKDNVDKFIDSSSPY